VVVNGVGTSQTQDDFVNVVSVDVAVGGIRSSSAGGVIGERLLTILEVNRVVGTVVTADPAAKGIPAIEDVVDSVVIGVGRAFSSGLDVSGSNAKAGAADTTRIVTAPARERMGPALLPRSGRIPKPIPPPRANDEILGAFGPGDARSCR
jgi:hypothetical protein